MDERPQEVGQALDRVYELPVSIHVELGRKKLRIVDLLALAAGSVLELDALSGAPLAIYANDVLIAHGEAVVVGEKYGVRITSVVSPKERIRSLSSGEGQP